MKTIKVFDITGSRAVMDSPDGDKIYQMINAAFLDQDNVVLEFDKVDTILSMFLNSAIAPLYNDYDTDFLKKHLTIKNMSDEDKATLKRVNIRAKQFYQERKKGAKLRMEDVYGE